MYSHIEGTAFRRTLAVVAITALMVVGLAAAPALAEPPETHTDPATFDGIDNPCTGVAFEATGTVTVSIHEMHNGKGIVGSTTATGTSPDGYELTSRKHRFVDNGSIFKDRLTDIWENPNGSSFSVRGRFIYNITDDVVVVDMFGATCLDD